ncbi:hypothetical protein HQ590_13590, partial [bacterium]|nr:hypothetical protein [bacterium]
MNAWLASALKRHYPRSAAGQQPSLTLDAARGGQVSCQAVVRGDDARLEVAARVESPDDLAVQIRRVGYVPMPHLNTGVPRDDIEGADHLPGHVPDPLFPEATAVLGPWETQSFWITVRVPRDARPGTYELPVRLVGGDDRAELALTVVVHDAVLPARREFPVAHWFYADALLDWYKLQPFEEGFWSILDPYLANVVAHGQDMLYVPAFTPPLDGVKRPTQLLGVRRRADDYEFDWSLVRRWIKTARAHGFQHFEWVHLFTQWGAKHALRVYEEHGVDERLLWDPETAAT